MTELLTYDRSLFELINHWNAGWLGDALTWSRYPKNWTIFYILLIVWAIYRFKKLGALFVLFTLISFGLSDMMSSRIIKPTVERARPCHTQENPPDVALKVHCGSGYSFTSSHATNHMCIGVFWFLSFGFLGIKSKWRYLFIIWALFIGFAQIYVGVHYPVDVISGFLLGWLLGNIGYLLFEMAAKKSNLHLAPALSD